MEKSNCPGPSVDGPTTGKSLGDTTSLQSPRTLADIIKTGPQDLDELLTLWNNRCIVAEPNEDS